MPIREYTNPLDRLRPNDAASGTARAAEILGQRGALLERGANIEKSGATDAKQAGDESARGFARMGALMNEGITTAGKVGGEMFDKFVVQPELSKGAAAATGLFESMMNDWRQRATQSDPNDQSIGPKFHEDMEKQLDGFVDKFNTEEGRKFARGYANSLREHMTKTIIADNATRAGDAAVQNVKTTVNNLSSAAFADHTSADFALAQLPLLAKATINASPGITPDKAAEITNKIVADGSKQIIEGAIRGLAERDPKEAIRVATSDRYDPYLTGKEKGELVNYAVSQARIAREEKKAEEEEKRREARKQQNLAAAKIVKDNVVETGAGTAYVKAGAITQAMKLMSSDYADPHDTLSLISAFRAINNDSEKDAKVVSDPDTIKNLQALAGGDDPNALLQANNWARVAKLVSDKDWMAYNTLGNGMVTNPAIRRDIKDLNSELKKYEGFFLNGTPLSPGSPFGKMRWQEFNQWAMDLRRDDVAKGRGIEETLKTVRQEWERFKPRPEQMSAEFLARMDMSGPGVSVEPIYIPGQTPLRQGTTPRLPGDAIRWDGKETPAELAARIQAANKNAKTTRGAKPVPSVTVPIPKEP